MKSFEATVWGARGSIPAPSAGSTRYGSETSCIELRCGQRTLLLDAGTGIVACSRHLKEREVRDLDILLTHCHFDHVIGLPFAAQLYDPRTSVRIHAGHFLDHTTCHNMVERLMCPPYFPVTPKEFAAAIDYRDFRPPDVLDLGDGILARTLRLDHPDGAVGYRIEFDGRTLCYVTDTESRPGETDEDVLAFIEGSDVLIYDCTFTDEELPHKAGFGHSTWQEGVRLCKAAGVAALVVHHHDYRRDDAWLDALAEQAKDVMPGAIVGGTSLRLAIEDDVRIVSGI